MELKDFLKKQKITPASILMMFSDAGSILLKLQLPQWMFLKNH